MKISRSWLFSVLVAGAIVFSGGRSSAEDVPVVSKENGPFMVLAYSFRGPQAEARAQALATELRDDQGLAACVFSGSVVPGRKDSGVHVLIGDARSSKEAFDLGRRVKKIKPKCLDDMPYARSGLTRAKVIQNPLQ